MAKCSYCTNPATTEDALGLPACAEHAPEADTHFKQRYGRDPNADTYLYCGEHLDLWQAGCARCEECCQHHYGCSVKEKFGDAQTPEGRGVRIIILDPKEPTP